MPSHRLAPTLALIAALPFISAEELAPVVPALDPAPAAHPWNKAPAPAVGEGTLTVSATRLALDPLQQPYAFYRHDRDDLDNNVGRTALDRIDYGPGVIIQHTAPGQTSPYIRGLTGKQSLLLLDGVRLSHATMRGGPNQYSALVPDMSIDSIDVILGSSGVVTGSDGLTGAMDFRLAEPGRGVDKPLSSWVSTRLDSANGVQLASGIDGAAQDWLYSVEGSVYDFHDRVGGKDMNDHVFGDGNQAYDAIPNTAYEQFAVAARTAYVGIDDQAFEVSLGHTYQNDARRTDGYYENSGVDGRISRYYDPETFTYLHLRHAWTPQDTFVDRLETTVWWHAQNEEQKREDLASGGTVYRRREYDDRIDSIGVEAQATSRIDVHEIMYGAMALFETTGNAYREFRNLGGTSPSGATAYQPANWDQNTTITDGAQYNTFAVYAQDLWAITDQWSLLAGLRYTRVDWDFDVASGDADDLTGSVRASWQFRDDMMTFVGLSKAFRAPNLTDLDGATDRGSSGTPSFGNPDLDSEVSYTIEGGWRYAEGRDELAVTVFYTVIDDIIQTVYPSGGGAGTLENGDSAFLRGFEMAWDYGLPAYGWNGRLALVGSISYTDSEAEVSEPGGGTTTEPISRANRMFGIFGLRYDIDANWWTRAQMRFHDAYDEDDVASGDDGDVRLTVPGRADGTVPGFAVFDASAGWRNDAHDRWLTMTLENLAHKTYRQLGSGADASGFNAILTGGIRF